MDLPLDLRLSGSTSSENRCWDGATGDGGREQIPRLDFTDLGVQIGASIQLEDTDTLRLSSSVGGSIDGDGVHSFDSAPFATPLQLSRR
jgi:hypothetical protein